MKRLVPAVLLAPALLAAHPQEKNFTLPNGLQVVLLEDHSLPQIRVHLALDFEARRGFASFTGALLDGAGAGSMNLTTFTHAVEERGAWLQSAWRSGTLEWRLQVGTPEFEGAMELLGHSVFRPVYEASRVERLRSRLLRQVQERSPRDAALDLFLGELGHPDGGRMPAESDLRRITFQELVDFRREISDPRHAVVVIHGDASPTLARQVMLQSFGTWTPPKVPVAPAPDRVSLAMEVNGLSAEAWAGRRIEFADEAEREAFDLLAEVFGRRTSRDPFRIQWVRTNRRMGVILAWATASPAELLDQVKAIARQGITPEELDYARNTLRQRRAMLALHPRQMVEECLDRHRIAQAGTAEDPTLSQTVSLLEGWLKPEGLRTLVVKSEKPGP